MDRHRHSRNASRAALRADQERRRSSERLRHQLAREEEFIKITAKSVWRERYTRDFSFFCPMCRVPKRIGMHPRPGQPIHFLQVGITTALFTLLTWSWFGIKGVVAFVPFWTIFEIVYRTKVRAGLACDACGFDPVLYLVEPQKAKEAIRAHWRVRFAAQGIPFPGDEAVSGAAAAQENEDSEGLDDLPMGEKSAMNSMPSEIDAS